MQSTEIFGQIEPTKLDGKFTFCIHSQHASLRRICTKNKLQFNVGNCRFTSAK